MLRKVVLALTLCAAQGGVQGAWAKDLGVHGPLWEIEEESLLEVLMRELERKEADGEIDAFRETAQARTKGYVARPRPVQGLGKVTDYLRYEVDLSVTVQRDLADQNGVVFAKAGTTINPLNYSGFNKRIAVIDGDDAAEVLFAVGLGSEFDVLLVLVNGDPLALQAEHGRRFYFDQNAAITTRFEIEKTPSVITRGPRTMIVEEIPVERRVETVEGAQ